jgi:opacity protein-like surface antigen
VRTATDAPASTSPRALRLGHDAATVASLGLSEGVMERWVAVCAVLALGSLVWTPTAASQEGAGGAPAVTLGLGLKGGLLVSLLSEPDESTINLPVPGFGGAGGGVGLALDVLYGDFVGLELDFLYMAASGSGEITFPGGFDVDQELRSTDLQLAVLLKLQLAYALGAPRSAATELAVKPYLGIGATFVFQTDSEFTVDQRVVGLDTAIDTESYTMFTVSLGAAIDAGPMRIPIELRGSWQPLDDDPRERADFEPQTGGTLTRLGVRSTWEAQLFFLVGVQYRLELH